MKPDGTVADTPQNRAGLIALHLDPVHMLRLEQQFGTLDWRIAASHAVYWATLGLAQAREPERLACRRAVYQPLIQCVLGGRWDGDLAKGEYRVLPNPRIVGSALAFMEETLHETPSRGVRSAYGFFLLYAIRQAHASGNTAQCETWLRDLNRVGAGAFRPMTLAAVLQGQAPEMVK